MSQFTTFAKEHIVFLKYLLISVTVTVIDITVSRASEQFSSEVIANTIGVVTGFVIQYFLCSRQVFNKKGMRPFVVFFSTWVLGLALADMIVYYVRVIIFDSKNDILYFFLGKGFSIIFPFFITYFIRKKLLLQKELI